MAGNAYDSSGGAAGVADFGPAGSGLDLSFLDPPVEPGELGRIAHYRVVSLLGVGGMGVVLRAEDTHLRRTVALKVMRREFVESYTSRERFLQEARVAASLESEYIATVYQVGMHNDVPFLAMQYLVGESLDARLDRSPPLPIPEVLLVARQVACGLVDAHARGLVHRDIKPANIWLEADPQAKGMKRAKLLDFGLARVIDSVHKLTNMGVIIGTPQYMSPEQACGSPVDHRADLFSLGAVLYVMLTGQLPFTGPTAAALLVALVSTEPRRAAALNRSIPPVIDDLIAQMMAKAPGNRPASAREIIDTLDGVLCEYSLPSPNRTSGTIGYPTRTPLLATPVPPSGPMATADNRWATTVPGLVFPTQVGDTGRSGEIVLEKAIRPAPAARPPGRWRRPAAAVAAAALAAAIGLIATRPWAATRPAAPAATAAGADWKVGVLFAESGPTTTLERSLHDATMLAIDDLNAGGGVLGRPVTAVELDAGPTPDETAVQAQKLLKEPGVHTIFGCPPSDSRRTIRSVVERAGGVLFYSADYEGMERTTRTVYTGPTAAQRTVPAVKFLLDQRKYRRVFFFGSNYLYPQASAAVVRDVVNQTAGARVVGEHFEPPGDRTLAKAVAHIQESNPDIVFCVCRTAGTVTFVEALRAAGSKCPILHLCQAQAEDLELAIGPKTRAGDMVACTYLADESDAAGAEFAARFRKRYGPARPVTDGAAGSYAAVLVWAAAVTAAGSADADAVLAAVPRVEVPTPFGVLKGTPDSRSFALPLVIGQYQPDGRLTAVHRAGPRPPELYPPSRSPEEWDTYLHKFYRRWGDKWRPDVAK